LCRQDWIHKRAIDSHCKSGVTTDQHCKLVEMRERDTVPEKGIGIPKLELAYSASSACSGDRAQTCPEACRWRCDCRGGGPAAVFSVKELAGASIGMSGSFWIGDAKVHLERPVPGDRLVGLRELVRSDRVRLF